MTFVRLYLVGYFVLFLGACVVLWRSGVLGQIPTAWIVLAAFVATGLGVLLAVVSSPRKVTSRH